MNSTDPRNGNRSLDTRPPRRQPETERDDFLGAPLATPFPIVTVHTPRGAAKRPRISAQKLGEYLAVVRASDRRRIIRDQKYPPDFKITYYREARAAFQSYCISQDICALSEEAQRFASKVARNRNDEQRHHVVGEAFERLLASPGQLPSLGGYDVRKASAQWDLTFEGVRVSVRPEVVLMRESRRRVLAGAAMIYLSKKLPLGEKGGQAISTLLYLAAEKHVSKAHLADCMVLDVFAGAVHQAPKSWRSSVKEISAACREIADRWEHVEE